VRGEFLKFDIRGLWYVVWGLWSVVCGMGFQVLTFHF